MPYQIVRNDIIRMHVDAIVNPTDAYCSGSGGTDARIYVAAGPELRAACDALLPLEPGSIAVTDAFRLPCRFILHTTGPIWQGGGEGEPDLLAACYRNALCAAESLHCSSVAIPLIASGAFGYPKDQVMRIALDTIHAFLLTHELTVSLVVYDKTSYEIGQRLQCKIDAFIDEHYIEALQEHLDSARLDSVSSFHRPARRAGAKPSSSLSAHIYGAPPDSMEEAACIPNLDAMLQSLDEGFSVALLKLIDRKGLTDAECYKRANIDKRLFSKIRSNPNYRPSKPTVLAFAVALHLSLAKTNQLLEKAGLALTRSSKFDVIIEFFLTTQNYNLSEINQVLYQYDQPCLGNVIE